MLMHACELRYWGDCRTYKWAIWESNSTFHYGTIIQETAQITKLQPQMAKQQKLYCTKKRNNKIVKIEEIEKN